jgi:hypothetical protein
MSMGLFPTWKEAVRVLLDGGLTFGATVTRAHLAKLCDIKPATSVEDVRRYDLEVLDGVYKIREALLTNHCMLLVSDGKGGFTVVNPEDQTRIAVDAGTKAMKREMGRMAKGVSFIRSDMLTDDQRAQNADAQAKISLLAGMVLPASRELLGLVNLDEDKAI